mmetsp:Transcript_18241/g.28187  ORF Transcript_18241/g.28187 Transcript_18241/m.28187 type:complete len:173 (+) Transcript_18241:549-1067(+)
MDGKEEGGIDGIDEGRADGNDEDATDGDVEGITDMLGGSDGTADGSNVGISSIDMTTYIPSANVSFVANNPECLIAMLASKFHRYPSITYSAPLPMTVTDATNVGPYVTFNARPKFEPRNSAADRALNMFPHHGVFSRNPIKSSLEFLPLNAFEYAICNSSLVGFIEGVMDG